MLNNALVAVFHCFWQLLVKGFCPKLVFLVFTFFVISSCMLALSWTFWLSDTISLHFNVTVWLLTKTVLQKFSKPQFLYTLESLGHNKVLLKLHPCYARWTYFYVLIMCCHGYVQDDVIGSGYVTALTLQQFKYTGKAYVLGSSSLAAELSQVGVTSIGIGVRWPFLFSHWEL